MSQYGKFSAIIWKIIWICRNQKHFLRIFHKNYKQFAFSIMQNFHIMNSQMQNAMQNDEYNIGLLGILYITVR